MLAEQAQVRTSESDPRRKVGRDIFHSRFSAEPHAVRGALRASVARFARQISPEEAGALELVLAEVLNNIVEHSYAGGSDGVISLSIVRDLSGLSCAVSDDGIPLPEGCLAPPCLPSAAVATAQLPEGGFGWYLIHDLTQDLGYRRDGGQNLLAFRLPIGVPESR
ncbi:MAG: ATP-binding protein [Rhodobacteraceae bacterium]|nr:ATP-binding protein [Paracoccaceae bacterium]